MFESTTCVRPDAHDSRHAASQTCGSTPGGLTRRSGDARSARARSTQARGARRRAERASERSTQARGARRRAERASARSTQARGAHRRAERASARSTQARGRAGARCSRPSGPAFLFSFGRIRKFAGQCRGGGAPGVGPRGTGRPPRPRTHAKHLCHSRGGLKVSVAPGYVLSCSSFPKDACVSRVIRIADARTPKKFVGSETHTDVSQTLRYAARIGIRMARTILGGYR